MDDLLAARLQMAVSLGFHIVFAMIGIGMPVLMALAEARWIRTGSEVARRLAKSWAKGTAIFFAVGAVSGTVLSIELGLLWPAFMEHAGGIIGLPFGLEGFAFFTEGIFLGVYLYAWDRIPKRAHLASGIIVAISGALSAVFIIMVNAWMNTPEGFQFDPATGIFSDIDPLEAMITPHWAHQFVHQLLAAYASVGFAVAGVHAFGLLRDRASLFHREALGLAMTMALPAALLVPVSGHWAAQEVAQRQPAKLAAMEGQFETEAGAPLRIGGIPFEDEAQTRWAIEIPGALSFLAFNDFGATVTGLDAFPRDEWPPVAIVHFAFQLMVACGTAMAAVASWWALGAWRVHRAGRSPLGEAPPKMLCLALMACAPLGFIAIEAGWIVTEVGRQPWIIYGVMRTADSVSPMPGLVVPFVSFSLIYVALAFFVTALMVRQFRLAAEVEAAGGVPPGSGGPGGSGGSGGSDEAGQASLPLAEGVR